MGFEKLQAARRTVHLSPGPQAQACVDFSDVGRRVCCVCVLFLSFFLCGGGVQGVVAGSSPAVSSAKVSKTEGHLTSPESAGPPVKCPLRGRRGGRGDGMNIFLSGVHNLPSDAIPCWTLDHPSSSRGFGWHQPPRKYENPPRTTWLALIGFLADW